MREVHYIKYACSYCEKEFNSKFWCEQHELDQHKCNLCKHSYLVYNSELECALKNKGEECKFEKKDNR